MRMLSLILCMCSIIYTHNTIAIFSFKKLYSSIIPSKMEQETIFEEHNTQKKVTMLTVKNKSGNILVKTDAEHETIFLKATKRAYQKEDLAHLTFSCITKDSEAIIEAKYDENTVEGSIDLELIVPQKFAVTIQAQEGSVKVCQTQGPLQIVTHKGSIDIHNAYGTINACTQAKGSITLHNPRGRIKAQTNNGNITIYDAQNSIMANTHYGSIELFAKDIPSTSAIKLSTVSGSILLHLPPDVNAVLQASTKYGMITSDHFITLKPHTTQLNRNAWKRLQKEIDGTLGSGEAQITVSSVRSDIKLIETKVS